MRAAGAPSYRPSGKLTAAAEQAGWDLRLQDAVGLQANVNAQAWGEAAAWRIGVAVARVLRCQEAMDGQPIGNQAPS